MVNSAKPRFNQGLDNRIKNQYNRTIQQFEKMSDIDGEVKTTLTAKLRNISSTLRGGEYLVFSPEKRLNDAKNLSGNLESYLQAQIEGNKLNFEQTQKVREYALGLQQIVEKHIEKKEIKRIEKQRELIYFQEATDRTQKAIGDIEILNKEYASLVSSQIAEMNKIMKGEVSTKNEGRKIRIRSYTNRISFMNGVVGKLLKTVNKGYENKKISADQAKSITQQTMKLLNNYAQAPVFRNKKSKVSQKIAESSQKSIYETVMAVNFHRNYFKSEIIESKRIEAINQAAVERANKLFTYIMNNRYCMNDFVKMEAPIKEYLEKRRQTPSFVSTIVSLCSRSFSPIMKLF